MNEFKHEKRQREKNILIKFSVHLCIGCNVTLVNCPKARMVQATKIVNSLRVILEYYEETE